ncbi:unnamed protein product, partial [Meganyctiphanes norvegica]
MLVFAWQQAEIEKARRYNDLLYEGVTDPDILARAAGFTNGDELEASLNIDEGINQSDSTVINTTIANNTTAIDSNNSTFAALNALKNSNSSVVEDTGKAGGFIIEEEDDDDDFVAPNPKLRKANILPDASQATIDELRSMEVTLDNLNGEALNLLNQHNEPRRLKIPKIFFGTRTHKQIAQIVKELKRTKYRDAKTVVLGSREHTCIHPVVSKSKSKNEGCRQLLDPNLGSGCRYKNNVYRVKTHELIQSYGLEGAWDIEDMVQLGRKKNFCPYFTARELMATAEIVFCPYNYLVDPSIRKAMMINLKGQIVILDEAHNIEDSAREAASCKLEQEGLLEARNELEKLANHDFKKYQCEELAKILSSLSGWIVENSENLNDYTEFDRSGKIFSGTEMIAILDNMGYSKSRLEEVKGCFVALTEENDSQDENEITISANTKQLLGELFMVLHFLFKDNMKYRDDYKIALVKAQQRKKVEGIGTWIDKSRRAKVSWTFSINFWCLNPAVSFHEVGEMVRSIILTSGTLSPMTSFQSELGVPFSIQLEANHVIQRNQVFVGTLGKGPTNQTLQATYRFTETWGFQDELGRLILSVCKVVPHGVLCFLPSYSLLNKLVERWQATGLWDEISKYKFPLCEPRRSNEFEETISAFYDTIRGTKDAGEDEVNGAFFMAVCRGKVSEGLDFADDNARAVIAVGIPFPNFKDIQVDLKKKYNDLHCRSRGLLTGSKWYEIQAYRALNQALGRCIRHKYDWGALLLVDERFQQGNIQGKGHNKYVMGLSKWVRGHVNHQTNCMNALSNLKQFAVNMTNNPPKKPELVILKKEESSKLDENLISNEVKSSKDSKYSDSIFRIPISSVKSEISNELSSQWNTQNINISNISQVEGLSNTIVADMSSIGEVGEDIFLSPTSLVIPSGKPPFTSTQISGPSYTSTQMSNSLSKETENNKKSIFKNGNEIYEFQFLNTQLDNKKVSPLKLLIKNEIKEITLGNGSGLHEAKKMLRLDNDERIEENETKSNNRNNTSSPDLFDSDEDLSDGKSPLKTLSLNSSGPPPNLKALGMSESQKQSIQNFFTTFGGGEAGGTWKESENKEKNESPICKKPKQELELQISQKKRDLINTSTLNDSDLDDFNLDQSYSTPTVRKVVRGKRRTLNAKTKGVVFEEFD